MFGIGPEVTVPFPMAPFAGLVTLRYYTELGNRIAPQGDSFYVTFAMRWPGRKT